MSKMIYFLSLCVYSAVIIVFIFNMISFYQNESHTVTPLECLPPPKRPRIAFSKQLLNFGILPSGLCIQKNIWVVKCDESVKWKIVEVRYSIDTPPHMEIINSENISIDEGKTSCTCSKQKISYRIKTMAPLSWVSMLLLISTDTCPMEIESLCIITYQVINYEITINKNPDNLLLCPMKILYTGVPHTFNVTIANHSPITGLYYFLKPFGESTEFLDVEITPNEGVLRPLGSKTVEMKITGKEVGIFENLYIPCFINKGQECKIIRVLCAIDTIHLAVYLPGRSDYFQKITWPPKILYEYDEDWVICPCTLVKYEEYGPEMDGERLSDVELKKDENNVNVDFKPIATSSSTEVATVEKTISVTENSSNSTSKSSTESVSHNLKSTLQEQFGDDLFLQDFVIEVHQVRLRTPTKLTFFLENTTPVTSSYTVEAINFFTTKTFDKTALKLNIRKEEDIWDDMIMNEYGILVLPDTKEGELKPFGVIEINITVFANTWGIYQEEIAVDVVDIPCFAFSLLIEVVGCPVMFPMALFKITDYPTVRYSFIHSPTSLQQAVNIQLATPQPVNPFETILDANSSEYIDIKMSPGNLKPRTEKTYVTCSVVGRIVLDEQHRKKLNYYFRETDFDCKDLRIENVATLEWPVLRRDFVCGETTKRFYANDIIFNKDVVSIRLVFQNGHTCAAKFEMGIDDPLEIVSTNAQREEDNTYLVQPLSCLEVIIRSTIDHKRILQLSELVYPKKGFTPDEKKDEMKCVESVDYDNRILHIVSNFRIVQDRKKEKVYPINLFIYFPNISAKPCTVRLDQVFLGNTRKALVTVFNETGCAVSFEIFKSLASEILYISPHYGRIEKSTGVNKSFVDIFIYFTPREARQYQESIRIVTNIPNYFIEIIIKASGSINEKFHVDYKI